MVLEDRLSCPGNLYVYLDKTSGNTSANRYGITVAGYNEDGTTDTKTGNLEKNPEGIILEVGVGMIDLFAYTGTDGVNVEKDIVTLKGDCSQLGELFTYHRKIDFTTGYGSEYIKLEKQYTEFTIKFPGVGNNASLYICGQTNRFDMKTRRSDGESFSTPASRAGDVFSCRILRQGSEKVCIELRESDKTTTSIPIDGILKKIKYDWGKKDLDDISIIFDKNGNYISASIRGYIDNDYTTT